MDKHIKKTKSIKKSRKEAKQLAASTQSKQEEEEANRIIEDRRRDEEEDDPLNDDEEDEEDDHEHQHQNGLDDEEEQAEDEIEEQKERLKEEAKKYRDEIERRGVVYLSSLPPFMKPAKVKHLLEKYAPITRIYLVEEDGATRKRRIKSGGNRKKKYEEGWVEFADKTLAKQVANHVNGTLVGGKKRNFYHDDMWNIKYLKGFKWRHLTEKLAYERRVREQKLRVEMIQAKKENALFAQLVEQKKQIEGMESRKRKKREEEGGEAGGAGEGEGPFRVVRRFRQRPALEGDGSGKKSVLDKSLLKNVFQGSKKKRKEKEKEKASS